MKNIQSVADKTAISLSFICALHCLAIPFLVVLLPSFVALNLENEAFHLWMLAAVIPTSLFAITMGCKKHRQLKVMVLGTIGLSTLIAAAFLGHDLLGEFGEKLFSVIGAGIIALAHWKNHQLCRQSNCECHS